MIICALFFSEGNRETQGDERKEMERGKKREDLTQKKKKRNEVEIVYAYFRFPLRTS